MNDIRQALDFNLEFEVYDFAELRAGAAFRRFHYRINPVERSLSIQGPRSRNIDTIFGGTTGEDIVLEEEQIAKLPHDMVHCSLHGVPEGQVRLNGYTPDICIPVEGGMYDVLEITTAESGKLRDVTNAMNLKIDKYGPLAKGRHPLVKRLNVLVVTPDQVYDLNGPVRDLRFSTLMRQAYTFGLEMARAYADNPGFKESNKFSTEETKMLLEEFMTIKWKEDGLISRGFFERDIPDHPAIWKISERTFEKKHASLEQYEERMRSRQEQREEGIGTIVHLPMLLVDKRLGEAASAEQSNIENPYALIFNHCLANGLRHHQQHDFETLRILGEMDTNPKPKRQPAIGPDMIHVRFSEEDKVTLAMRGLLAVKHKLDSDPSIIEKRASDKLDVNYDEDLGNLSLYISSPMQVTSEPCISFEEVLHCFEDKAMLDYKPLIEEMSKVQEIKALHFLDLVFKEIDTNLVRSPRDTEYGRNFVFRMIPGYEAFVVIRNTSPASMDQSHIFYSVFFKGSALVSDVFEDVKTLDNGWSYTEFLSTDQLRLSQMQNIHLNALVHWFGMVDEAGDPVTGNADGLSPDTELAQFLGFKSAFRMMMMILIEDKQVTSGALQDLRYYYMELNTAFKSSVFRATKLTSKLPSMIRSRLLLYIIRTLISIHKQLPSYIVEKITKMDSVPVEGDDDDGIDPTSSDPMARVDLEKASFYIASGMDTPFHFKINTPADMVRAMYMGYMHNKNEGFKGHGVVKMLEKTLKMAYVWRDLGVKDAESYCAQPHADPDLMKTYQHSAPAVKVGSELLKRRLMKRAGLSMSEYPNYIKDKILRFALKSTLEDLATTKASTIPFQDLQVNDPDGVELKLVGQKRKCIEAILSSWSDYKHPRTAMNVAPVLISFNITEAGHIKVTLFKKNQIGGTREIYVLTIRGRILTKIFSDMFRAICELHPSEVLTKPENKATFVSEHYQKRRSLQGKYKVTYKVSEDKTTWAQLFNLFCFADMSKCLLPVEFWPFAQNVLSAHKAKELQLPRSLVEQFLRQPLSELSSDNVDRLKREFTGQTDPCLLTGKRGTCFSNPVDMMQGILHYPSSCYHLVFSEYQTALTERWLKEQGMDVLAEFLVSSDDEGDLISFASDDRELLRKTMGRFHNVFGRITYTVDKLFGIETSDSKTSRTYADIFEVNSEFYFGNTCQKAISKFENNAIYDDPGESLHLRISALYAKIRELRGAGGSGALCYAASALQCLAFTNNLGVRSMGWYKPGLYKELTNSLTTVSGYYFVFNELKAGLMDTTYVNWLAVKKRGEQSAKIVYFLNNYALPLTEEEAVSAKFSMYPRDKYKQMLKRLGLGATPQAQLMDEALFKILMCGATDIEEEKKAITYHILTPNIAKSLVYLNRTHVDRMAPYVMWASMYRDPDGHQKYSLPTLLKKAASQQVDPDVINLKSLFPMSDQFDRISELNHLQFVLGGVLPCRRLYNCQISPQYFSEDCIKHMKDVMSFIWFHKRSKLSRRQCNDLFSEIEVKMPWVKRDLAETVSGMPLKNLHELYAFLNSTRSVVTSFSALVRGRPKKSFSSVQALLRSNTFSRRVVNVPDMLVPEESGMPMTGLLGIYQAQKVADRIRAWKDLLQEARESDSYQSQKLLESFTEDVRSMAATLTKEQKTISQQNSEDDRISKEVAAIAGEIGTSTIMTLLPEVVIYESVQERRGRTWVGTYSYIHKMQTTVAHIRLVGQTQFVRANCSREDFIRKYKITPDAFERTRIGVPDAFFNKVLWIKNNLMIMFGSEDRPYYMDLPRTHVRQVHFSRADSPLDPLLEHWLSRGDLSQESVHSMLSKGISSDSQFGITVRSLMRICKKSEPQIMRVRVSERLEHASAPTPALDFDKMVLSELLETVADALEGDGPELEDFLDVFDVFVNDADSPLEKFLQGMEATALESFSSMMDSNRTLFTLLKMMKSLQQLSPMFLDPKIREAVQWYKGLKQ